jgi:hypothetical protein
LTGFRFFNVQFQRIDSVLDINNNSIDFGRVDDTGVVKRCINLCCQYRINGFEMGINLFLIYGSQHIIDLLSNRRVFLHQI